MEKQKGQPSGSFRFFMKVFRGWKNLRDRFASALDVDFERKVEIYTQLSTSATLKDIVYWLQIFFSAGIATLGLVQNSTAVVIGAMLISPLMAPILSQGLALATGDLTLGVRALANLILSTLLGVVVAVVLVVLLPFKDLTSEIIGRTEPNTLDLGIALFSGAIGAVAICRDVKGVATSIPGVAIAVALMPPLCVIGFGIGYAISVDFGEGIRYASGGGLLYLTNLVAITFTAMLVFVSLRIDTVKVRQAVHDWRDKDEESQWWLSQINRIPSLEKAREVRSFSLRLLMILLPLLIIFIPLSTSFSKMRTNITKRQYENKVSQSIRMKWKEKYEEDTEGNVRSYLDELRVSENKEGELKIYMRVFDNRPYTQGERSEFISQVAADLDRKPETISLQLVEIPTSEREDVSPVIETTPTPLTIAQRQTNYIQEVSAGLSDIKLPNHATKVDHNITLRSDGSAFIEVFYLSSKEIDSDGRSVLQDSIRRRLDIQNLSLVTSLISSDERKIVFKNGSTEIDEGQSDELSEVANDLRRHARLKLRVILSGDEDDKERFEEKKRSVVAFFSENGIEAERLVFGEVKEGDLTDTCQFFIRS